LGNAICLVPALLMALSRSASRWLPLLLLLDASAILAQISALCWASGFTPSLPIHASPFPTHFAAFPLFCATLISAAWWQNFVHPHSFLGAVRLLAYFAARLRECRSKTYVVSQ
jgi:hypothetical protein